MPHFTFSTQQYQTKNACSARSVFIVSLRHIQQGRMVSKISRVKSSQVLSEEKPQRVLSGCGFGHRVCSPYALMWDVDPPVAMNGWAPITGAQGWCFYSKLQWLFRGFSCSAIQNPPKLSSIFLPNLTFVSFQNQWIIVLVIAMGMETAYLGLAIASLAFWALTVVEVRISLINSLLLSSCYFFSSSKLPSCLCTLSTAHYQAWVCCRRTEPGQICGVFFSLVMNNKVHDKWNNKVTLCLCMDRQNVTRGIFPLGITLENMT